MTIPVVIDVRNLDALLAPHANLARAVEIYVLRFAERKPDTMTAVERRRDLGTIEDQAREAVIAKAEAE